MLTESLQALTQSFSEAVMAAIHGTPIGELVALAPEIPMTLHTDRAAKGSGKAPAQDGKKTRLARRTPEMIGVAVQQAVVLLKKHPAGLRAEAIRTALDLDVREVPAILKAGVASRAFKVLSGQKRSTTYGISTKKASSKKVASKPVKKALKKVSTNKTSRKAPKRAMKKASKKGKK